MTTCKNRTRSLWEKGEGSLQYRKSRATESSDSDEAGSWWWLTIENLMEGRCQTVLCRQELLSGAQKDPLIHPSMWLDWTAKNRKQMANETIFKKQFCKEIRPLDGAERAVTPWATYAVEDSVNFEGVRPFGIVKASAVAVYNFSALYHSTGAVSCLEVTMVAGYTEVPLAGDHHEFYKEGYQLISETQP